MFHSKRIIFWIFAAALLLRIVYLYENTSSPYFSAPILDELYLDTLGQQIAAGVEPEAKPYFRAPLYPSLLGLVYSIDLPSRFFLIRLLQHVMGALICVLMFLIADEAFGKKAGIAAGIIAVFYGPLIFYEGEILIVTLFTLLNCAALYLLLIGQRRGRIGLITLGGLALGLAIITRPNILLFVPIVVLWLLAVGWKSTALRTRLLRAVAFAAPICLLLCMTLLRNYIVAGDPVLVSSQGGINFYYGNGPVATGMPPQTRMAYGRPEHYRDKVEVGAVETLETIAQQKFTPSEVSDTWYKITLDHMKTEPRQWAGLMIRKCVFFWNDYEIKNNKNYHFCKRYSALLRLLPLGYGLVAALGLAGIVISLFVTRSAAGTLPVLYVAVFMGSLMLFFVCARLRMPVVAGLIPLAGLSAATAVERFRKSRGSVAVGVGVLAALLAFTYVDWYGVRSGDYSQELWTVGQMQYNLGDYEAAIDSLNEALEQSPESYGMYLLLGHSYLQIMDHEQATESYASVIGAYPDHASAYNGLGICFEKAGDTATAVQHYIKAAELDAGYAKPRINAGVLLSRTGKLAEGRAQLEKAIALDSNDPEGFLGLAVNYKFSGDSVKSEQYLAEAVRKGGDDYRQFYDEALNESLSNFMLFENEQ